MKEKIELNRTWISLLSDVIIQILSRLSPGVVKMLHWVIQRQMESNFWLSKCLSALSPGVLNIPYWVILGADGVTSELFLHNSDYHIMFTIKTEAHLISLKQFQKPIGLSISNRIIYNSEWLNYKNYKFSISNCNLISLMTSLKNVSMFEARVIWTIMIFIS